MSKRPHLQRDNFGIRARPGAYSRNFHRDLPGGTVTWSRRPKRVEQTVTSGSYPPWPFEMRTRLGIEADGEDPTKHYLGIYYGTVSGIVPYLNADTSKRLAGSSFVFDLLPAGADGLIYIKASVTDTDPSTPIVDDVGIVSEALATDIPVDADPYRYFLIGSWVYDSVTDVVTLAEPLRYSLTLYRAGGPGTDWFFTAGG